MKPTAKKSITLELILTLMFSYFVFGSNFVNYLANPENSSNLILIKNAKVIEVGDYQPQIKIQTDNGIKRLALPGHIWQKRIRSAKLPEKTLSKILNKECNFELKKVNFLLDIDYSIRSIDCKNLKRDRSFFEK